MALITPEFLQTKTYSALRDRLMFQHGGAIQGGVWDAGDFKITQRAAGANMTVDAAAGYSLVPANDPGNLGLYHLQNDASVNVTGFVGSNASLPRIDSVYVQVNDTTHGGDATDVPTFGIVTGTATAGATLDNRTGAGALPNGALLLADILIPAASSTIVTANIRDRRAWARGAHNVILRGATGTDYTTTTVQPTFLAIDATNLAPRVECTGTLVKVGLHGTMFASTNIFIKIYVDGVAGPGVRLFGNNASNYAPLDMQQWIVVTPGSHIFEARWGLGAAGNATFYATDANVPMRMTVDEDIRQNANNS